MGEVSWYIQDVFGHGCSLGGVSGFCRTGTNIDVVWVKCQGIYRTGTDMGLVLTECQGIYSTGTDMDVVWAE